ITYAAATRQKNVDQIRNPAWWRGHVGPAARICGPWSGKMAISYRDRLAVRSCHWLSRIHGYVLPRLAAGFRGRGHPHSVRVHARGLASLYTGPVMRF